MSPCGLSDACPAEVTGECRAKPLQIMEDTKHCAVVLAHAVRNREKTEGVDGSLGERSAEAQGCELASTPAATPFNGQAGVE